MSNAECLVLGLLYEGFRYGHEIDRVIEQRNIRQWAKISRMGIYKVLDRLTERGWLEVDIEREGIAPERNVYRLTQAGLEAFRHMVAEGLASEEPVRFDYSVSLAYLGALPVEETIRYLRKRQAVVAAQRRHLDQDVHRLGEHLPIGVRALMRHDRAFYRLEERWLKWLIRELEKSL